jgi:hypothetical protein
MTSTSTGTEQDLYARAESDWGWTFFAGTVLGLAGVMRIIDSIWAFRYHGALPDNLKDGVLGDNLHTYGWVWLIVGALLVIASFLVMSKSPIGRWFGIFAAAVGAITGITWMPYYPFWSLLYVGVAVLVFYGLLAHGGRNA